MTDPNILTPRMSAAVDALGNRLSSIETRQAGLLSAIGGRRRRDAARLAIVERELAAALGEKAPEVARVRGQREACVALADQVASAVERARNFVPAGTNEEAVFGSIQTDDGRHAQNVVVRLIAMSDKTETVVREVKTNRTGDFSIQIPRCEINPKATWKLVVRDDLGATLASEPVAVGGTKGFVPFVPLTLRDAGTAPAPQKTMPRRKSAKSKG